MSMKRSGAIALAVLVAVALLGVAYQSQRQELVGIASRERIGIDSRDDCYLYNGADLKAYSDNHSTAKIYLMGDTGNVGIGGTLVVTGAVTMSGGVGSTGQLVAGNGLKVTQNITQVSGSTILNSVTVSGTLDVQGVVSSNGGDILRLNENALVTGTLGVSDDLTVATDVHANTLTTTDAITVGGTLRSVGIAYLQSGVVTSTLSAYTLSASQNITASGALTASTYGGFGALYTAVSSTLAITNAETIIVGVKGVIPLTASDGDVGGSIAATLNDTTSLGDGAYLGQMLILVNVDTDADLIVVKDNANTSLGKDRTLDVNDSMTVFWDGSNWRILSILDASA